MKTAWWLDCAIALCLGLGLVGWGPGITWAEGQKTGEPQAITTDAECQVKGMAGGCCLSKIESSLLKVKGIKAVKLDKKAGTVRITLQKGAQVSGTAIKQAIKEADKKHDHGFEVIAIKETSKLN